MKITVEKITDDSLLTWATSMTIDKILPKVNIAKMYASEHSPIRTQVFKVEIIDAPLYAMTHLLRHTVGSVPFALTQRSDRKNISEEDLWGKYEKEILSTLSFQSKGDQINSISDIFKSMKENIGRQSKTSLGLFINAQSIIDISKLRLCSKASSDTRMIWQQVVDKLPDENLKKLCVPKCVYRGGICTEPVSCNFNKTKVFQNDLQEYLKILK